jgi:hypothetical protein
VAPVTHLRKELARYLDQPGRQNTEQSLKIPKQEALKRGIDHIVVASTPGKTGLKAAELLSDTNLHPVVVTRSTGFRRAGEREMPDVTRAQIEEQGGEVLTGPMIFHSLVDVGTLRIPWEAAIWALLLGVPGYFLYSVLASGLGVIAGYRQQAKQLAGVLGMLGMAPLWFAGLLIDALDGPLAVALTLFPLSAPMIGLIRMALVEVPTWQLVSGLVVLIAGLIGSIRVAARIFRAAMLMYGRE